MVILNIIMFFYFILSYLVNAQISLYEEKLNEITEKILQNNVEMSLLKFEIQIYEQEGESENLNEKKSALKNLILKNRYFEFLKNAYVNKINIMMLMEQEKSKK